MKALSYIETLIYYDGPELIIANDQLGIAFVCLLIEVKDDKDRYFCAPLSKGRLHQLIYGEVDLRSIFETSETREYFIGDVIGGDLNHIEVSLIDSSDIHAEWFPEPGLYISKKPVTDNKVVQESVERNRAVVHCVLNPPEASIEAKITVEHLSQAIKLFQRVIRHAYGKAMHNVQGSIKEIVTLPENYELEIFAFSPGSFTLHMQATAQADLLGFSYVSKAFDILDAVNLELDDPQHATEILAQYGGHFVTAYKDLLQFIFDNQMPFAYEWSMPERKESTKTRIIPRQVKPLLEALRERVDIGEEDRRFTGRFTKVDEKLGTWRLFSLDDQREYSGESDIQLAGLIIETQKYELLCVEKLEEERGTGKEIRRLILRSLKIV